MADLTEEYLTGGTVTAGLVRVGDTVRRPPHERSEFVRQLLQELERSGCELAPRCLGVDDQGRDVQSFLHGDVEPHWRRFSDEQVAAGGRLLRRFHDATRALDLRGEEEVVCHGDAGPHNCVFRSGLAAALIDFDLAAPGPALQDVGYAAWAWCLSYNDKRGSALEQARQLRLFADGYGLLVEARRQLVDAVIERQSWSANWWRERFERGLSPSADRVEEIVSWNLAERTYVEANRALFVDALSCPAASPPQAPISTETSRDIRS